MSREDSLVYQVIQPGSRGKEQELDFAEEQAKARRILGQLWPPPKELGSPYTYMIATTEVVVKKFTEGLIDQLAKAYGISRNPFDGKEKSAKETSSDPATSNPSVSGGCPGEG